MLIEHPGDHDRVRRVNQARANATNGKQALIDALNTHQLSMLDLEIANEAGDLSSEDLTEISAAVNN